MREERAGSNSDTARAWNDRLREVCGASEGLVCVGSDSEMPLVRTLESTTDPVVKTRVVSILGRIGGHRAVSVMAQTFRKESTEVRWAILEAGFSIKDAEKYDFLETALSSPDVETRT